MIPGKFLIFSCQGRKYAIELHQAREVRVAENIVPFPGVDETILGIFNLRGQILKVKDLGLYLHHEKSALGEQSVLVYLEGASTKTTVVVDQLLGICSSEEVLWSNKEVEILNSVVIDYFTWREELIQVLSADKIA